MTTKLILKAADLVTCDSNDLRDQSIKFGSNPHKTVIIQWGVETSRYSSGRSDKLRERLGWAGHPVVLSTRRLKPLYNTDILIEAIPEIIKHVPEARFLITGEGNQLDVLKAKAERLGLSGLTKFLGWVDYPTLVEAYQTADIFISIPSSDGTAVSLLEAMACELPVIVTDIPSNREWIQNEVNGFLIPVRDVKMLSGKIIRLLRNRETGVIWGRNNREIVLKREKPDSIRHKTTMNILVRPMSMDPLPLLR